MTFENLSDETIQKLAEAIAKQKGGFYVEPEAHYNQHRRMERFLDAYDNASGIVVKSVIGILIVGVIAAMALGLGWTK